MWRISGNGTEEGTQEIFFATNAGGSLRQRIPGPASSAAFRRGSIGAISGSERVDSRRQPRQLPRDRVLVEHALGYRPMHFGLRQPERRLGRRLVTSSDRRLDPFHKGAHPAHPSAIDSRTLGRLPDALFR